AAAKLRRAQEAAEAARPYAERMDRVLGNLASSMTDNPGAPPLLVGTGSEQVHLLVVATAERGLAGGFNSTIARLAREHIRRLRSENKEVKILCVGKKGYDILKRDFRAQIFKVIDFREVRAMGYEQAEQVGSLVLEMYEAGDFDVCTLFYNRFESVISQVPTAKQLVPAEIGETVEGPDLGGAIYEYEPDEEAILRDLLPRNVTVQVFRSLLENAASEQGARMTAMDNATRNAGDLIDKLTIEYNRSRQAQITKELIEIISGAEAL
ncbi:MAG: F0F1 ATP synthase subunit gamma, partial [Pseudomonadota bacterium]